VDFACVDLEFGVFNCRPEAGYRGPWGRIKCEVRN